MKIPEAYDYLVRARRDLWTTLEAAPDEILSRPVLAGDRFHCIKDLVMHVPMVEDSWIHEDILRDHTVRQAIPAVAGATWRPAYADFALATLLDYWRAVERSTLGYLETLTEDELERLVADHDAPEYRILVDLLRWHVMIHEMRHTAQIAVLLRMQGLKPPSLDLLFYLPSA